MWRSRGVRGSRVACSRGRHARTRHAWAPRARPREFTANFRGLNHPSKAPACTCVQAWCHAYYKQTHGTNAAVLTHRRKAHSHSITLYHSEQPVWPCASMCCSLPYRLHRIAVRPVAAVGSGDSREPALPTKQAPAPPTEEGLLRRSLVQPQPRTTRHVAQDSLDGLLDLAAHRSERVDLANEAVWCECAACAANKRRHAAGWAIQQVMEPCNSRWVGLGRGRHGTCTRQKGGSLGCKERQNEKHTRSALSSPILDRTTRAGWRSRRPAYSCVRHELLHRCRQPRRPQPVPPSSVAAPSQTLRSASESLVAASWAADESRDGQSHRFVGPC